MIRLLFLLVGFDLVWFLGDGVHRWLRHPGSLCLHLTPGKPPISGQLVYAIQSEPQDDLHSDRDAEEYAEGDEGRGYSGRHPAASDGRDFAIKVWTRERDPFAQFGGGGG